MKLSMDNQISCHTASTADTIELGRQIGRFLAAAEEGLCVPLVGDLGTGKTHLAQGIAAGFGVTGEVTSPTFAIMNTYETLQGNLYHFDLYRLDEETELENIGFAEFTEGTKSIVEWADKFHREIPEDALWIYIKATGENERVLTMASAVLDKEQLRQLAGDFAAE